MTFNLQNFATDLAERFKDKLDQHEVQDLLDLKEQYNKDTPISTGKRLVLNFLAFKGMKSGDDKSQYSGNLIDYQQEIFTGINVWIADNLKGKSSIFKIIKFALTGHSSLKTNIKGWIKEIILSFNINDKEYTIYLDTDKTLKAYLVNGKYRSHQQITDSGQEPLIEAKGEKEYEQLIQEFFFKQFSYYSLRWTQKHPSKEKNELMEVGASWKTYFMSMLLESKDSGEMYGAQGKKIFEMLLGLELTYPINRLKVKADLLNDQKAKDAIYHQRTLSSASQQAETLKEELKDLNAKIADIDRRSTQESSISSLYDEYNRVINQIKEVNSNAIAADNDIQIATRELNNIRGRQEKNYREGIRVDEEMAKVTRNILDLKEYLEIGIFFSNLDIKHCPNCSHKISDEKKQQVHSDHKCYVCDHSIEDSNQNTDPEAYEQKIADLGNLLQQYEAERQRLNDEAHDLDSSLEQQNEELERLTARRSALANTTSLTTILKETEERINREKLRNQNEERSKLISERAVMEYRLNQAENDPQIGRVDRKLSDKIALLNTAVSMLSNRRFAIGEKVLKRLSDLILSELHALGLTSVSEINISETYDIFYKQDGEFIPFSQIAEGEQLRAKIAFYLSIIQLDIEFNFGRHTRFLIIDSPGKEEADENYLRGLSMILKGIQERFGNDLQILIGTAERDLEGIVEHQNIIPKNTFVF